MEYLKNDQVARIAALERAQEDAERKARLIEAHTEVCRVRCAALTRGCLTHVFAWVVGRAPHIMQEVDAVIAVVRAALAQAVDWQELARVIKERKRTGDPLAGLIHSLKLDQGKVSVVDMTAAWGRGRGGAF